MIKSWCFLKLLWWRAQRFFQMKEASRLSCVKIIVWSVVVQEGTNTAVSYIFEYGAEYGAECSVESGAK